MSLTTLFFVFLSPAVIVFLVYLHRTSGKHDRFSRRYVTEREVANKFVEHFYAVAKDLKPTNVRMWGPPSFFGKKSRYYTIEPTGTVGTNERYFVVMVYVHQDYLRVIKERLNGIFVHAERVKLRKITPTPEENVIALTVDVRFSA